ncbi:MAG: BON domain-containing protein [Polaromonas sp.]|nr:BON domain-containing protein [Polaromonas sp.]
MNTSQFSSGLRRPVTAVICSAAVLLALTACGKGDDGKTVGQSIDSGIAKTEQVAKDAKDKAAASIDNASANASNSGSQTAGNIADKVDDVAITASVSSGLAKDPDLSAIKINVDTKDGVVTLNGPAPTSAAKDKATDIAKQVKGVASVNNQLVVKAG